MEPASRLIDEASDLAGDGKTSESVKKYRQALAELDRIEKENPERAKSAEFATLRNKRAYVNAAIDTMLMSQVKGNAKAVAVSDTTELEKKLAKERGEKVEKVEKVGKVEKVEKVGKVEKVEKVGKVEMVEKVEKVEKVGKVEKGWTSASQLSQPSQPSQPSQLSQPSQPSQPRTKREQAMFDIANGDFAAAEIVINEMLAAKPNNAMALNLKATMEARQGKLKEAERTLDQAINSNPRSHFAYYNMAILMLQANPDNTSAARRYYETGRTYGGPKDESLEALLK